MKINKMLLIARLGINRFTVVYMETDKQVLITTIALLTLCFVYSHR